MPTLKQLSWADLERMARESRLTDPDLKPWMTDYGNAEEAIKRFAALVLEDAARFLEVHSRKTYGVALPEHNEAAAWLRALKDKP